MKRRTGARVVAILLAGVLILSLVGGLLSSTATNDPSGGDDPATLVSAPPVTQASDLPPIALGELPGEAIDTLNLVAQDGPFPYDQDGSVFQNREGLLPPEAEGYYREYTVITPGEDDRGARRLVIGEGNEVYYTDDHYESFRELVLG